jgi:hypothetical protein
MTANRATLDRVDDIVVAAKAFVLAHCELEALALQIGVQAAYAHPLTERVIELHMQLEAAVLGDEPTPGRRYRLPGGDDGQA